MFATLMCTVGPQARPRGRSRASSAYTRSSRACSDASSYAWDASDSDAESDMDPVSEATESFPSQAKAPPAKSGFEVGELHLSGQSFDPAAPSVRSQLLRCLGASPSARVEAYKGCYADAKNQTVWFKAGNMNQGIWFLKDRGEELVLKLVKFDRFAPAHVTAETEVFRRLYREIPSIANDPRVAFPTKIFKILGPGNARSHDLHVMRRMPGRQLDSIIESCWKNGRRRDLMAIFRNIGKFLAEFHGRYGGRQHCDVGPQNIFYDEATEQVSLVDLGMMGARLTKSDVEQFAGYIQTISKSYGAELLSALDHFRQGYQEAASQAGPRKGKRGGA
eukprot:TRINITY_DN63367_c0_g1_i1.p1 TRINITY_DN63367_c0_g1~~TRINITY_DN63367_c0_g1_i1.p1  ORF type:complete len:334 (-),score=66.16 TRINITY_DN63367_c0_g1_i1:72-1073(-)